MVGVRANLSVFDVVVEGEFLAIVGYGFFEGGKWTEVASMLYSSSVFVVVSE